MSKNIGKNRSIQCNVTSCQNHCGRESFCSLDKVVIGTHETDPAMNQCTDCQSFKNISRAEQKQAIKESEMQNLYSPESPEY